MNGALYFNGLLDRVIVLDTPTLGVSNLTVAAWVKVGTQAVDYETIISKRGFNWDWDLLLDTEATQKFLFCVINDTQAATCVPAASSFVFGQWYHLVGAFDGAAVQLNVNGVSQGTAGFSGTRPNPTSDVTFGVMNQNGTLIRYFNGTIDEVLLYNRGLTSTEVSALYSGY